MKLKKLNCLLLTISLLFIIISVEFVSNAASPVDGGYYCIQNVRSNKYLTFDSSGNLYQSSLTYLPWQRFRLDKTKTIGSANYYNIVPDFDGWEWAMDVDNALDVNTTRVKIHPKASGVASAQNFRFLYRTDGTYRIRPELSSDKVVEIANASTSDYATVQIYTQRADGDSLADCQIWRLVSVEKSVSTFDLVDSGKHLDYSVDDTEFGGYVNAAMLQWNSYKAGVVRKDTWLTTLEIEFIDYENMGNLVAAQTSSDGKIRLNKAVLSTYGQDKLCNVMTHEMGHALGMGHLSDTTNVMYVYANTTTVIEDNNKDSYDLAYSRY